MKKTTWAVTALLPPQGRQDLASFPLHHTPLIRWQTASRSQQPHCTECWMLERENGQRAWAWIPSSEGCFRKKTFLHGASSKHWRVAGIQDGGALVCREIKLTMRVTTDLAGSSHCASVSGSKENQSCAQILPGAMVATYVEKGWRNASCHPRRLSDPLAFKSHFLSVSCWPSVSGWFSVRWACLPFTSEGETILERAKETAHTKVESGHKTAELWWQQHGGPIMRSLGPYYCCVGPRTRPHCSCSWPPFAWRLCGHHSEIDEDFWSRFSMGSPTSCSWL